MLVLASQISSFVAFLCRVILNSVSLRFGVFFGLTHFEGISRSALAFLTLDNFVIILKNVVCGAVELYCIIQRHFSWVFFLPK